MARDLPMFTPPAGPGAAAARTPAGPADRAGRRRGRRGRGGRIGRPPAPPGLDPGADAVGRELPRPQGPAARPQPQHGLRGGPLPQHRGVLGPAHGHDHDPGRHLHPGLRVLRGQDRPPDLVRRRRAAPRGRGGRRARPRACRRHQRRARRPARRRRRGIFAETIRADARDVAGHGHRGAHPGLRRRRRPPADRDGRPPRHPQPQPRDGEAPPEAGAQARPLGPQPVRPASGQGDVRRDRLPGAHQVEPDGRPGRDARRAHRGVRGAARGRRRHPHDRPVPAAVDDSTCRSSATTTPTSSRR